jgi:hypothetical protein
MVIDYFEIGDCGEEHQDQAMCSPALVWAIWLLLREAPVTKQLCAVSGVASSRMRLAVTECYGKGVVTAYHGTRISRF